MDATLEIHHFKNSNYDLMMQQDIFNRVMFHKWFLDKTKYYQVGKNISKKIKTGKINLIKLCEEIQQYSFTHDVTFSPEVNEKVVKEESIKGMNESIRDYIIHKREGYFGIELS